MNFFFIIFFGLFLVSCTTSQPNLDKEILQHANWEIILPPPPQSIEIQEVIKAQGEKQGKRWIQATKDADIDIFNAFSLVLGEDFNAKNYPEIAKLANETLKLARPNLAKSKDIYLKKRPFEIDKTIILCPNVTGSGSSYPSGHAAIGWIYGNLLTRIFPNDADAIFARAREYGESRVICGVHFPSDIVAGRLVGDVVLQKLQTNAEFTKLLYFAQEKAKLKVKPK